MGLVILVLDNKRFFPEPFQMFYTHIGIYGHFTSIERFCIEIYISTYMYTHYTCMYIYRFLIKLNMFQEVLAS